MRTLLLLLLVAPPIAAQSVAPTPLASLWDGDAVARVLKGARGGPRTPQPVLLAFDETGTLERLATTDTVAADLRALLRDSVARHVRSDSLLAARQVRLYLLDGKPMQLVPPCDVAAPGVMLANQDQLEQAAAGGDGPDASRLQARELGRSAMATPMRGAVDIALVMTPEATVAASSASASPPVPAERVAAVRRVLGRSRLTARVPEPCLLRAAIPVSWVMTAGQ